MIKRVNKIMAKPFFLCTGKFEIIAHRGSSREYPENTMESFRRALEIYPEAILEMDVWPTSDGNVMVMHDGLLELSTNGTGPVVSKSLDELLKLEAGYNVTFDGGKTYPFRDRGYRLVTLPDVLKAFPESRMSIDIKYNDAAFASQVVGLIEDHNAVNRVIVGSFHNRIVYQVRKLNNAIATSFSKAEVLCFVFMQKLGLSRFFSPRGDALMIPEYANDEVPEKLEGRMFQGLHVVTPAFIRSAREKGIPLFVWTVNRKKNMVRLIEWGVDGIVTDLPGDLKNIAFSRSSP